MLENCNNMNLYINEKISPNIRSNISSYVNVHDINNE